MSAEPVAEAVAGVSARADGAAASFLVADPQHALAGITLKQDLRIEPALLEFRRAGDDWVLALDRPPVCRLEYLLELRYPDGRREVVPDPGNPLTAPGAFGSKSVLVFPGYGPPAWLGDKAVAGSSRAVEVPTAAGVVTARIWAPGAVADTEPLPLLLVHDGPEYDALADLTRYLSAGIAGGWLPRLRAALLAPGPRDEWYSANPRYARALRHAVFPALTGQLATTARIGMGTSLGALAMLHAHCRYPGAFDALFLQSGSFFVPRLDSQERWFPHYRRITRFIAGVHSRGLGARPVPVVLTCGAPEENAPNNRLMARTMARHDYPVTLHETPDLHNYTAWRDAFDPGLTELLRRASP
ncbi:MAG: alpha/beta hydrolase [Streptosporangiaceae bacterium]